MPQIYPCDSVVLFVEPFDENEIIFVCNMKQF